MNLGGDAAEQVVRLSLEGVEVAAKITGEGAKNIALLLAAVLKEEHKTQGKARLSNMIKSGKELKVFSVQNKDLKKFSQEAKRYGVLYCVLKDKDNPSDFATVDVIARAEDASKIQRIMERFELASVDKASVVSEIQKDRQQRNPKEKETPQKSDEDRILDDLQVKPIQKESNEVNPHMAKTEKSPLSEQNLKQTNRSEGTSKRADKPSVREKLNEYKATAEKKKEQDRSEPEKGKSVNDKNKTTVHKEPVGKKKRKTKER